MPITSQVDPIKNLTIYTLNGDLALDEILNAIQSFWEAHELTLNVLWDARRAKLTRLKSSDIERIAELIGRYTHRFEERRGGKTAVVASSDLQYGLSRILGTFYEIKDFPTQFQTFRQMDEAIQWLEQKRRRQSETGRHNP